MARKTKAEQQAEQAALKAARMLADAEAYPAKLMAALAMACSLCVIVIAVIQLCR
jgi:hypothetical protein